MSHHSDTLSVDTFKVGGGGFSCGAISEFLALRAGPFWRRRASELIRAGCIAAIACLMTFISVAAAATNSNNASNTTDSSADDKFNSTESDAAKMFLIGCLKLIALARLYEACCRASRLGVTRWLGPAAVMTMACCPLVWLCRISGVGGPLTLCRPTELAAYFVLMLDLNCLFRAAVAATSTATATTHESVSCKNVAPSCQLDRVIAGPVISMATAYAFKGASFFIGGRIAANNVSPQLCQVCYTMALALTTCACLHVTLLPAFLVRLSDTGPVRRLVPIALDSAPTDASYYYQYYGSRKQEIKAVMVAGVLLLQSLGGEAGDHLLGRLCSLMSSPAWDLCLALPYCIYLCVQFAVCEQASNLVEIGTNDSKVSPVSSAAASISPSCSVYTQTEPVWRKRVLSETSSCLSSAPSPQHLTELRHTLRQQSLSVSIQQQQQQQRSLDELLRLLRSDGGAAAGCLGNAEYLSLMRAGHVKPRQLESLTGCPNRSVELRRLHLAASLGPAGLSGSVLAHIPYQDYDWKQVTGRCCEEVIGLATLPLGLAGPLLVNGVEHRLPLATTEGCLVASVNRGCAVVRSAGGCQARVYRDGMTRAPVLAFPSVDQAVQCLQFAESEAGQNLASSAFEATSSHCRLRSVTCLLAGRRLHLRYCAETGDAMGMNMLSKAAEAAVSALLSRFPEARLISLSGNACSDKKPTAINWILGRGKSVVCEARLPAALVRSTLRASPADLVALHRAKNLEGSAIAGSVGGYNAHAANIAAAVFIACGQDPAQVVESSQALTCLELLDDDNSNDLYASVTMPCLEVGVVGGGTHLPTQKACLRLIGLSEDQPAACLAQVICAGVLCAEISLLAALANQELVASHMKLNRSKQMHQMPS